MHSKYSFVCFLLLIVFGTPQVDIEGTDYAITNYEINMTEYQTAKYYINGKESPYSSNSYWNKTGFDPKNNGDDVWDDISDLYAFPIGNDPDIKVRIKAGITDSIHVSTKHQATTDLTYRSAWIIHIKNRGSINIIPDYGYFIWVTLKTGNSHKSGWLKIVR